MSLLFVNARKIDVDGVVERFWMRVDGDTIVETGTSDASTARVGAGVAAEAHRASALSSSAPLSAGAEVVDLRGGTLVPGFIDLHGLATGLNGGPATPPAPPPAPQRGTPGIGPGGLLRPAGQAPSRPMPLDAGPAAGASNTPGASTSR